MHRKKWVFLILPLVLGFFVYQGVSASLGPPGSSMNPVITKSYADKVFQPLISNITELEGQINAYKEESAKLKLELASLQQPPKFTDVSTTHWAYTDITYMVQRGIAVGLTNTRFGADVSATRTEVAVMVVKALNLPITGATASFKDVPVSSPDYPYIAAAQKAGIIAGFPGGEFKPKDPVTRGQLAVILMKSFALQRTGQTTGFKDIQQGYWAYEAVLILADNGISRGYPDKTFKPANSVTRAETVVLLAKAMDPLRRI